jgi:hypothetical protein
LALLSCTCCHSMDRPWMVLVHRGQCTLAPMLTHVTHTCTCTHTHTHTHIYTHTHSVYGSGQPYSCVATACTEQNKSFPLWINADDECTSPCT